MTAETAAWAGTGGEVGVIDLAHLDHIGRRAYVNGDLLDEHVPPLLVLVRQAAVGSKGPAPDRPFGAARRWRRLSTTSSRSN
jgi:hypothetical protein